MLASIFLLAIAAVHGASAALIPRAAITVVQGNDDGWAVANIRRLFDLLNANGFSVRSPSTSLYRNIPSNPLCSCSRSSPLLHKTNLVQDHLTFPPSCPRCYPQASSTHS